jgi:hypothetical protein
MLIAFKGEVKIIDSGISKARSEPSFTQAGGISRKKRADQVWPAL